jgi:hypothetical protein
LLNGSVEARGQRRVVSSTKLQQSRRLIQSGVSRLSRTSVRLVVARQPYAELFLRLFEAVQRFAGSDDADAVSVAHWRRPPRRTPLCRATASADAESSATGRLGRVAWCRWLAAAPPGVRAGSGIDR